MADSGMDDFDFDEYGIYREKGHRRSDSSNGILLDDDGIWQDSSDHLARFSLRPDSGRPDSGFGTADRKSSTSTLNRFQDGDTEHDRGLLDNVDLQDFDDDIQDGLNISELEASGTVSLDQASIGSRADFEYPELNGDSDIPTDDQFPDNFDQDSPDGDSNDIRHGRHSRRVPHRQGSSRAKNGTRYSGTQERNSLQSTNDRTSIGYLLEGKDLRSKAMSGRGGENFLAAPLSHVHAGDSLFTQDDVPPVQHSLIEFENLEDALNLSDGSGGQMDLIGAYLEGIKEQDSHDEQIDDLVTANKNHCQSLEDSYDLRHGNKPRSKQRYNGGQWGEDLLQVDASLQLEDSLLDQQQPPFNNISSISFSTLEVTGEVTRDAAGLTEDLNTTQDIAAQRASRIPMLRSRSPSLTRPGSSRPSSASRSRPVSGHLGKIGSQEVCHSESRSHSRPDSRQGSRTPRGHLDANNSSEADRSRARKRSSEKRTLPPTPRRNDSGSRSSSGSPSHRRGSGYGRLLPTVNRSVSSSPARSGSRGHSPPGKNTKSQDNDSFELSMLVGDGDDSLNATRLIERVLNGSDPPEEAEELVPTKPPPGTNGVTGRPRPRSAEQVRPASSLPKDLKPKKSATPTSPAKFRIRSHSSGNTRLPMKAIPIDNPELLLFDDPEGLTKSKELAEKFLQEKMERCQNEETLNQLQQEYNALLQKYAEAENTIDSLRIGAKIPINVEITALGQSGGSAVPPQFPARRASITSLASASGQLAVPNGVSRPGSRMSQMSGGQQSNHGNAGVSEVTNAETTGEDAELLPPALGDEGLKLAFLAKSQAIQEQMGALHILLAEDHLSAEEQDKALQNIKACYEALQQEYRDAKDDHDRKRRQGVIADTEPVFDAEKTIEGELYKINMNLDEIEHTVQDSLKQSLAAKRKPFQTGPLKADHAVKVNGTSGAQSDSSVPGGLSPHRPPSVGSFAGGVDDVDGKLHKLNKEYDTLMDRYRRLRQSRKTPERDQEVQSLLLKLRNIYQEIPEHRKPALPPELENRYSSMRESFVAPSSQSDIDTRYRGPAEDRSTGLTSKESDAVNRPSPRDKTSSNNRGYTSSSSDRPVKRDALPPRHQPVPDYTSTSDSLLSGPIRTSDLRKSNSRTPSNPSRSAQSGRRDYRDEKDSGYMGSEMSRRNGSQQSNKDRVGHIQRGSKTGGSRTSGKSAQDQYLEDSMTSSDDRSTVEFVKRHRSTPPRTTQKTRVVTAPHGELPAARSIPRPRSAKTSHEVNSHRHHLRSDGSSSSESDEDTDSSSSVTNRSTRSSSKSDQLKNLQNEVERLKKEMVKRGSQQLAQQPTHVQQVQPVTMATTSVPYSQTPQYQQQPYIVQMAQPGTQPYTQGVHYPTQSSGQSYVPTSAQPYVPSTNQPYMQSGTNTSQPYVTSSQSTGYVQPMNTYPNYYPTQQTETKTIYDDPRYIHPGDYRENYSPGSRHPDSYGRDVYSKPGRDYNDNYHNTRNQGHNSRGYYSDSESKLDKLRDYYIPSKSKQNLSNGYPQRNRIGSYPSGNSYGRDNPGHQRDSYRPSARYGSHGQLNTHNAPPAYRHMPQHGVSFHGPPQNFPPPAYPGYVAQSHGNHLPPGAVINGMPHHQVQNSMQPTVNGLNPTVIVPNQQIGQTYVPVQVVPITTTHPAPVSEVKDSKVRYYVREYGSDGERTRRGSHNTSHRGHKSSRRHRDSVSSGSESETEELNESLNSAMRTAAHLKKMSKHMKSTLQNELSRSYRERSSCGAL